MRQSVIFFLAVVAVGCAESQPSSDDTETLSVLQQFIEVPIETRFADAVAVEDRRFLAVRGYALTVPSVTEADVEVPPIPNVLVIPGTSDAYRSEREAELNAQALRYAEQYNAMLSAEQ